MSRKYIYLVGALYAAFFLSEVGLAYRLRRVSQSNTILLERLRMAITALDWAVEEDELEGVRLHLWAQPLAAKLSRMQLTPLQMRYPLLLFVRSSDCQDCVESLYERISGLDSLDGARAPVVVMFTDEPSSDFSSIPLSANHVTYSVGQDSLLTLIEDLGLPRTPAALLVDFDRAAVLWASLPGAPSRSESRFFFETTKIFRELACPCRLVLMNGGVLHRQGSSYSDTAHASLS